MGKAVGSDGGGGDGGSGSICGEVIGGIGEGAGAIAMPMWGTLS